MPYETNTRYHCTCALCRVAQRNADTRHNASDLLGDARDALREVHRRLGIYASYVTNVYVSDALASDSVTAMRDAITRLENDYNGISNGYEDDDNLYYDDEPDYDSDTGSDLIHYHDYRPRPVFYGEGPLFMGFELETAVSGYSGSALSKAAQLVQDRVGEHAYLKEDGSISHGFEIVTHPMSYDYAMSSFPWEVLRDMRDNGIGPDGSTGLHVHVSRAAFSSPAHIYKWMKFIYRNQNAVEGIARRRSNGWAKFERGHRREILNYARDKEQMYYGDRYSAINVQNQATFEVRVFDSTVKRQELQAALGLVDASVRYTADIDSAAILNAKAWEFPAFVDWAYTAQSRGKSKASYSPLLSEVDRLELV